MSTLLVLGAGVLIGLQHATEADHLAAVAALVSREKTIFQGLIHGVAWGVGHTFMLVIVSLWLAVLGWVISPELAAHFEQLVGLMLITLGAHLVWRMWRLGVHFHGHTHRGTTVHFHGHVHSTSRQTHRSDAHDHRHQIPLRSVFVGMVHGLAGSAALALVMGQAMPTLGWTLIYIALFGLGSIIGMALLSGVISIPMWLTARHLTRVHGVINGVIAVFSMVLGLRMLLAVG